MAAIKEVSTTDREWELGSKTVTSRTFQRLPASSRDILDARVPDIPLPLLPFTSSHESRSTIFEPCR